jgi:serine protease Do
LILILNLSTPAHAELPFAHSSFAPLVKQTAPSVVNIYASRKVQQQVNPMFDDPFIRHFFGGAIPGGQMAERIQKSLGSGVIIRADGLIVTNAHVIKDADEIHVSLSDRREFPATVVLRDDRADLAVLRIDTPQEKLPALALADSDKAEVGDLVLAIGNPFGVGQTVTSGIVSASGRIAEGVSQYNDFIQTDAAINPGNSGGALVNMDGKLLGINAAIYSRDGGSLGIGFAIPANIVATVIDAAENGRKTSHPWIGLDGQAVTSDIATSLGMKVPAGVLLTHVIPGSPADKAGLKQGDVVLTVAGKDISDLPSLRSRLAMAKLNSAVSLTIFRDGKTIDASLTPVVPPETPPRETTLLKGREPLAGAIVENISPAVVEETGITNASAGVIVRSIANGTLAAQLGIQPNDVILGINNAKIESVDKLKHALAESPGQWRLTLQRGDQILNTVING